MIILSQAPQSVKLDVDPSKTLCIVHPAYSSPDIGPGTLHLRYDDFVKSRAQALANRNTVVVVGLNKLITPANRVKVGPHLLRPIPGVRRISIDTCLFISEPWRAWFHFGCVQSKFRDYTYSYLAESQWKGAQDGLWPDPFSIDEIKTWGAGVVRSENPAYFDSIKIQVIQTSSVVKEEYQELKTRCFADEHTPSAIISRLAAFAQQAEPRRNIPAKHALWKRRRWNIICTDLAVDRWLTGELSRMAEITNAIAAHFFQEG